MYLAYKIAQNRAVIKYEQMQNSGKISLKFPNVDFCDFIPLFIQPKCHISHRARLEQYTPSAHFISCTQLFCCLESCHQPSWDGFNKELETLLSLNCGPLLLQPICLQAGHAARSSMVICHLETVRPFSSNLRLILSCIKLPFRKRPFSVNLNLIAVCK